MGVNERSVERNDSWVICGSNVPKSEVKYVLISLVLCIVIIFSLLNLTYNKGSLTEVWLTLLSYCLGCLTQSYNGRLESLLK